MRQQRASRGPGDVGRVLLLAGLMAVSTGCSTLPSADTRAARLDALLTNGDRWHRKTIEAGIFVLAMAEPRLPPIDALLTVYIEGDGLAWSSRSRPARDPTPVDPVALRLALRHVDDRVAYLARPCQWVRGSERRSCRVDFWTGARFAPEVIASFDRALDLLKTRRGAERLVLVGYSGGGTVAALVAARREDVVALVTVAGNLDPVAWTGYHDVTPLSGSLDPRGSAAALSRIPQWHWTGSGDRVVPPNLIAGYRRRLGADARVVVRHIEGFDHHCCWVEAWPGLLAETLHHAR